ncbi:MAG TPA: electron transfer flavoprotein subunit alpha/FixB family protein [Cellulomonas sp.]
MSVLVFAETPQLAADLVQRATALDPHSTLVALRPADAGEVAADVVLTATGGRPEDVTGVLASLVRDQAAGLVLLAATIPGREIAARLAMRLGAALVPEATSVTLTESGGRAERVVHAGGAVQTLAWDGPAVVTVAPRPQTPAPRDAGAVVERQVPADTRVVRVACEPLPHGDVDLAGAERIVCVGMGLRTVDDLGLAHGFAAALEAQVACTRPVAEDRGWLSSDCYIGISGLHVSPRLYVGIGVSGQVQHAVGMRGSTVVVAVNSDERAPAVADADHVVVGDLYQVVPALTAALQRRAARG